MADTDRLAQALRTRITECRARGVLCQECDRDELILAEHDALASLAPAAVDGEPVAWMVTGEMWGQNVMQVFKNQTKAQAFAETTGGSELFPLYTAAKVAALTALRKDLGVALDMLCVMFDKYESGDDVFEEPDTLSGHMGKAIQLSESEFSTTADLLNRLRPVNSANGEGWT